MLQNISNTFICLIDIESSLCVAVLAILSDTDNQFISGTKEKKESRKEKGDFKTIVFTWLLGPIWEISRP